VRGRRLRRGGMRTERSQRGMWRWREGKEQIGGSQISREGGRVTLVVADDEDVLDLEHVDRVLQHGKEGHIRVHHQVRNVPRHED